MAKSRVIVRDRGLDGILRRLNAGKGVQTSTGVQGSEAPGGDHGTIDNANLAAVHEFGAPSVGIPQRSFMGATFDAKINKYVETISDGLGKVIDRGGKVADAMALAGEAHLADIIRAIDSGISPPNKPSTVDRKGSSKPLIDTGQLKQSLTTQTKSG